MKGESCNKKQARGAEKPVHPMSGLPVLVKNICVVAHIAWVLFLCICTIACISIAATGLKKQMCDVQWSIRHEY